jgi:hypothetical protein
VEDLELLGAPRAWLWVVLGGTAIAIPTLFRGFLRRGKGSRHEKRFWLQRAPQFAAAINLFLVSCAFEAIEFVLGTGEPAFATALASRSSSLVGSLSGLRFLPTRRSSTGSRCAKLVRIASFSTRFTRGSSYSCWGVQAPPCLRSVLS